MNLSTKKHHETEFLQFFEKYLKGQEYLTKKWFVFCGYTEEIVERIEWKVERTLFHNNGLMIVMDFLTSHRLICRGK